jgi:hypothetical protein
MALEIPIAPKLKQWLPFWGVRPQGGAVQKRTGRTRKLLAKTGFNHIRPGFVR